MDIVWSAMPVVDGTSSWGPTRSRHTGSQHTLTVSYSVCARRQVWPVRRFATSTAGCRATWPDTVSRAASSCCPFRPKIARLTLAAALWRWSPYVTLAIRLAGGRTSPGPQARQHVLRRDPLYRERVARHVSASRGGRVVVACPICERSFELTPSEARTARRSCGRSTCKRELRQQTSREVAARAEVRTLRIAGSRRRGVWPAREHVQRAPASGWSALAESDAVLVRLLYGLPTESNHGSDVPLTLAELGRTLGIGWREIHRRLARSLEQLLGRPIVRPRTSSSSCVVCNGPVMRSLTAGLRATCSAACLRALGVGRM
jgi:hypothetical protein